MAQGEGSGVRAGAGIKPSTMRFARSSGCSAASQITPEIREDHASYIHNWLKVLKDDKRAIFTAASHASKAVDFLHGLQPQPAVA
jgi:antirestriction protein ArdC